MPRLFLLPTVRAYRTLLPPTEGAVRKHIGILALECLHSGWYFKFVARVFMSMHRHNHSIYRNTMRDFGRLLLDRETWMHIARRLHAAPIAALLE